MSKKSLTRILLKQTRDQLLHFLVGGAIVLMIALALSFYHITEPVAPQLGWVASVVVAVVREFYFQLPIERPWDTALDLLVWMTGATVGMVMAVVV